MPSNIAPATVALVESSWKAAGGDSFASNIFGALSVIERYNDLVKLTLDIQH